MPAKSPKGPPIPFPGNGNGFGKPQFVVDLTPFIEDGITSSIDIGSVDAPATKDVGSAAYILTDDFTQSTNIRITNFSPDDLIQVSNNGTYRYTFGSSLLDAHDLVIARTFGTEVSWIVLDDVIPDDFIEGGGTVFSYESARTAIGFDFIEYDDITPVPDGGCFEQSIDIDTGGTDLVLNAAFAPFCFTDDAMVLTDVTIAGFSADDHINVTNASGYDYNFTADGAGDVWITFNDGTNFTSIVLSGLVAGSSDFIDDYSTAVAAVGYKFMTFECEEQTIDVGTIGSSVAIDATLDAICFTDDADVHTNVEIAGFSADDLIQVTNASAYDYNFTTNGDGDLIITFNNGTRFTGIELTEILEGSAAIVFDYDSAVAALGYKFMEFECVEQSIDAGTSEASVVIGAASGTFCFTDDADALTNVEIAGFGADDIIRVTNATAANYVFATSLDMEDLRIVRHDGEDFTEIVLLGALTGSSEFVFDYDSAVAAMGYDFMTFG